MNSRPRPGEFVEHAYQIADGNPERRPSLPKALANFYFDESLPYEMKNSSVWTTALEIQSMLPPQDMADYASWTIAHMCSAARQSYRSPMKQLPELIHDFLDDILRRTSRRELRERWGASYKPIMDRLNFIRYRIAQRTECFSRQMEKGKDYEGAEVGELVRSLISGRSAPQRSQPSQG